MLGPFATASRLAPIQQMSLAVLSCAACASVSTTTSTTTTRDRGDRYGPMQWAQKLHSSKLAYSSVSTETMTIRDTNKVRRCGAVVGPRHELLIFRASEEVHGTSHSRLIELRPPFRTSSEARADHHGTAAAGDQRRRYRSRSIRQIGVSE